MECADSDVLQTHRPGVEARGARADAGRPAYLTSRSRPARFVNVGRPAGDRVTGLHVGTRPRSNASSLSKPRRDGWAFLHYLVANVLTIAACGMVNFVVAHRLVFRGRPPCVERSAHDSHKVPNFEPFSVDDERSRIEVKLMTV